MGVITGYNKNDFISADEVYSKIKREWKSMVASNLLDDGEFPVYTLEVLEQLGMSVMMEDEDLLMVEDYKVPLPKGFREYHSAWRCDPKDCRTKTERWIAQPEKNTVRYDITCETVCQDVDPSFQKSCKFNPEKILNRVTVQQYIKDECSTWDFYKPRLLHLSPNVKPHCDEKGLDRIHSNGCEISINNGYIYSNFTDSCIYMKYYSYPMDCDGYPLIQNNVYVRKAVEWYIKYQILLNFWFDNEVSDISQRWGKAEIEYEKWFAKARYETKLPSFSTLMNLAKDKRALNAVTFFSQMDNNRYGYGRLYGFGTNYTHY